MTTRKLDKKKVVPGTLSDDLEAVVEMVRSLWASTDQHDTAVRDWGRKTIIDAIGRLNRQVTAKLRLAAAILPIQTPLFPQEHDSPRPAAVETVAVTPEASRPRFPDPTLRVFAKALAEHALKPVLLSIMASLCN